MKEIKIKHIKPMFTAIVTTMDRYEEDVTINGVMLDSNKRRGSLKEYQTVLSIGSSVRDIKVGDLVWVNPTRFGVKKHQEGSLKDGIVTDNPVVEYRFDTIMMNDKQCLLLQDRDIDFIVDEYEFVNKVDPSLNLVLPDEKKIITA